MLKNKSSIDKILIQLSMIQQKNSVVKVQKIKLKSKKVTKLRKLENGLSNSSIVNIIIRNNVSPTKKNNEKIQKKDLKPQSKDEEKGYTSLKDDSSLIINGGYGTISRSYGITPVTSYVNYERLFSYLGKFKTQNAYENMAEHLGVLNKSTESGSFVLADKDAMDKIGRFEKYMKYPAMDMPIMALSLVPIAGLSSVEWEEIKWLMKFDPVIYNLKTKIS
ncbi:hypothetical protein HYW99_02720 [Candidatus Woesearchaeota archaeon]|nr:hypothetical protein [Candidatus Woesearchaeota archaeon]